MWACSFGIDKRVRDGLIEFIVEKGKGNFIYGCIIDVKNISAWRNSIHRRIGDNLLYKLALLAGIR